MKYSDPQPTFDEPRKWVINLSTNDKEKVNHIISSINNVLKVYPQEAMKVVVVAYSSGMRVLKKDYDQHTLVRIKSLMEYDVEFIGCYNTMDTMHWKESDFIDGVTYVRAGIAEAIERIVAGYIPMTAY
ncbi:MAG: DsrE family protein [Campylobacterales bacterium]|nr:DsrE family protein [Campylobacterales bacterium]